MKRFLFLAACASLTLASCVNDERLDTIEVLKKDAKKVTFSAPVIGANSRAVEIEGGAYPETETFNVYAVRHDGVFQGWDVHYAQNSNHYFMDDETVKHKVSASGIKTWETDKEYYWPIGKFVTFGAYSPSAVATEPTEVGYNANGLYITDFEVPAIGHQYDLMFSRLAIGKTAGSGSSSATYSGVDIRFNHALSAIVFQAKVGGDYDAWIHKIELVDIHYKGNFSQGINSSESSSIQLQEFGNPVWSRTADLTNYVVYDKGTSEGILLSNTEQRINPESLLLLPQPFAKNVVDNPDTPEDETLGATPVVEAKIRVTYKVGSNMPNSIEESIFDLTQHWALGTRYTYTIEIGTKGTIKKITFSPTVEDWLDDGFIMEF